MACRTTRQSALPYLPKVNNWILGGVLFELLVCFAIVHIPALQRLFTTAPLELDIWAAILCAPSRMNLPHPEAGGLK